MPKIETLETAVPSPPDKPELAGPDHPMRKVTRQVAFEKDGWTKERAEKVAQLFDAMAAQWGERIAKMMEEATAALTDPAAADGRPRM